MKLNAGIVTSKLNETKLFYVSVLDFGISFENDFYLLLHTPDRQAELSFLLKGHSSQAAIFQDQYEGKGMYLTLEVDDVDTEYRKMKELGIPIALELRSESWGDRHFAILDPNGVAIDIVKYTSPSN